MTTPPVPAVRPAPMNRPTSIRRAFLFLALCAPIYLTPQLLPVPHSAVLVVILLGLTFLFLRSEGRTMSVLGLEPTWRRVRELLGGFVVGTVVIVLIAVCVRVALPFAWSRNVRFDAMAAAGSLVWLLSSNAAEELIHRGYSFERLIAGIGHWKAQLVTALFFAAGHIAQGWPWQTALIGTTVGSLLFGLAFVRWRSVPAAVGVHVSVNWVRDLLLVDPPTVTTLFAPLSPRPWTGNERLLGLALFAGVVLAACFALWRSILRSGAMQPRLQPLLRLDP